MKVFGQASRNFTWDLGSSLERRDQIRLGVRALVRFEWFDGHGANHKERGFTRDISSKGMFIFSDFLPPAKVDLQVDIFFGSISGAEADLELSAKALVIRLEPATKPGATGGFAVLNRSYSLANQAPTPGPEGDWRSEPN